MSGHSSIAKRVSPGRASRTTDAMDRLALATDRSITVRQFADVLERSTLAERRPIDEPDVLEAMVTNADLMVTAWDGELLVGVARSVTDFAYCCYLSDLAVDRSYQRRGIGRALIQRTLDELRAGCRLVLLSAPAATDYYAHIGFEKHPSAWSIRK